MINDTKSWHSLLIMHDDGNAAFCCACHKLWRISNSNVYLSGHFIFSLQR